MSVKNADFTIVSGNIGHVIDKKVIELYQANDNELVIYSVRSMATNAKFRNNDEFMVAVAASELATNILRYAGKGKMEINIIQKTDSNVVGIELLACDFGPGIADIDLAMKEQYSTTPNSLGQGLPTVKRIMDEFFIESIYGRGTRILARKWRINE
ncbi:MAG: anti-sigma regulatory factor [Velocimicrobium sp.]